MNRGIKDLQSSALPLGYVALLALLLINSNNYSLTKEQNTSPMVIVYGAEDGIRTRDPRLGKAMLYH